MPADRHIYTTLRGNTPIWLAYVIAVLLELALTAGLVVLSQVVSLTTFPVPYVLLTMGIAYYFGLGPAVASAVVGWFAFTYLLTSPITITWPVDTPEEWARQLVLVVGLILVTAATVQARKSAQRIERLNLDLEQRNTQMEEANTALSESEERFRTMLDAIPQLAWMAEPDGFIFWYNRRWYEYTGTTPEQMEGWGWQDVHDPQMLPIVLEEWKKSIVTAQPFDMEFPLRSADGGYRWFLTRVVPMKDSEGRVKRWFGTNTDISAKREVEAEIRQLNAQLEQRVAERTSQLQDTVQRLETEIGVRQQAEERLDAALRQEQAARAAAGASEAKVRQFLEMAPDGILVVDAAGIITFANNRAEELFGYGRGELNSMQVDQLVPERYRNVHPGHRADYAADPRTRPMGVGLDLHGLCKNGTEFPVEIALSPTWTDGQLNVTAIIRDITERKLSEDRINKLNQSLSQQAAELQDANRELEAFSYSVSHDLRAPLRAIDGFSNTLLKNYRDSLDPKGQDYLQRVRNAAQRMAQLIDDILGLSRATRAEMHREPVDLSATASEVLGELQRSQPQSEADITVEPGLIACADAHLLRIVLDNLLGNAWKFSGKRSVRRIEVGAIEQNGERVYYVRDNGAGFDPIYADKLFSPFHRLHTENEFPGTGIGLALVQRILRRHGGRIWAESAVDQGATFYFTLGEANT